MNYKPTNSPSGDTKSNFSGYSVVPPEIYSRQFDRAIDPLIIKILDNLDKIIILDVGCGLGSSFIHALIERGLNPENLYSLDPDEKNFEVDYYPRLHKIVGNAENLEFRDEYFDLVHSSEITWDNPNLNYKKVLSEIARVLKPGGFYLANERFEYCINKIKDEHSKELWNLVNSDYVKSLGLNLRKLKFTEPISPKILLGLEDYYVFDKNL